MYTHGQYLRRWCRHETVGSLVKMFSLEKKNFLGSLRYRKSHRQLDLYDLTDVILMSPFMEKGKALTGMPLETI